MKLKSILVAISAFYFSCLGGLAQNESFTTEQAAQTAAIKKFPELGKTDSTFSKTFIERTASQRKEFPASFDRPNWPWILAHQVNADLTTIAKDVLFIGREVLQWGPEGAREPKGVIVSFTNFSQKRIVIARIKTTFEDNTSEEKDFTIDPHGMESFSYKVFRKPVRDAVIVSAQFK